MTPKTKTESSPLAQFRFASDSEDKWRMAPRLIKSVRDLYCYVEGIAKAEEIRCEGVELRFIGESKYAYFRV